MTDRFHDPNATNEDTSTLDRDEIELEILEGRKKLGSLTLEEKKRYAELTAKLQPSAGERYVAETLADMDWNLEKTLKNVGKREQAERIEHYLLEEKRKEKPLSPKDEARYVELSKKFGNAAIKLAKPMEDTETSLLDGDGTKDFTQEIANFSRF